MDIDKHRFEKAFHWRWVFYTTIAFTIGLFLSIIVAYIVNIVYAKETNLVVGLVTGAVVGYTQWFLLKKQIAIRSWWGLACAIGMGIPFILEVILDEAGIKFPELTSEQFPGRILIGIFGGLLSGLLQLNMLKPHSAKAYWWLPASTVAWALCWLSTSLEGPLALFGVIIGGFILGLMTGVVLKWILNIPIQGNHNLSGF